MQIKTWGDSKVNTVMEIEKLLHQDKSVHFGGKYIQGWFIPQQIQTYEYVTIYE
jgi:hypothetical protein